jgi:hypothetical protein
VEVGYRLDDATNTAASEVTVDLLDERSALIRSASIEGKAVNVEYGPINIHQLTETQEGDGWKTIWRGKDGHGAEQRDHQNRRLVAVNTEQKVPRAIVWIDSTTDNTVAKILGTPLL